MRRPNFDDPELNRFLVDWDREINQIKKDHLSSVSGNNSVLLVSPDRSVFEVKVTDAGALVVTKVSG